MKSSDVIGSPSDQTMSSRRLKVMVRPSSEMPPFSAEGISVTRTGIGSRFSSKFQAQVFHSE